MHTRLSERYTLGSVLGQGGTATVYRAYDSLRDRTVAIKLIHPPLARSKTLRSRMEVEAKALLLLDHPNVVGLYEHQLDTDQAYLVMELVDGGNLSTWVARHGVMPPRRAVQAILQVCAGVASAHNRGIVHRDLKPQNMLVGPDDTVKVADFGIARLLSDHSGLTRTGLTMGTTGYMAPEQLQDAKRADHRADIFAIGVSLCALLIGRIPKPLAAALNHPHGPVPEALHWPLTRATLDEPGHRWSSVERLARALQAVENELPPLPTNCPALRLPQAEEPAHTPTVPTCVPTD